MQYIKSLVETDWFIKVIRYFKKIKYRLDNILIQGIRFVWGIITQQNIGLFFGTLYYLRGRFFEWNKNGRRLVFLVSALHPLIGLTVSPKPCLNLCSFK